MSSEIFDDTIILGAGIIGLSTAFYLSSTTSPRSIHLIDPSPRLFASCSGLAGGFLAKDWFGPSLAALGALSFQEHSKLAEEYDGREKWGYAVSRGVRYTPGPGHGKIGWSRIENIGEVVGDGKEVDAAEMPGWLKRAEGDEVEALGEEETLAQVDPLRLCQFLLRECLDRGVQLHHPARAICVAQNSEGELSNICVQNTEKNLEMSLPCSRLLIAAGAWSPQVFKALFPKSKLKLPISSLAGHSLVVRSPKWTKEHENRGCHAVFTSAEEGFSPEIFSRMGGEIYIAGLNSSSIPLPELATGSKIDTRAVKILKKVSQRLLEDDIDHNKVQVLREGLCFRPVTGRGVPLLSRISDEKLGEIKTRDRDKGGIFIAAGHGPWGISNSLGTGKVMAEMMLGRPTSANISGLGL